MNELLFSFFVCENNFGCIKDDDVVATVQMRGEGWLMFSSENAGYLSSHSAEDQVLSIHNKPLTLDFAGFGGIGTHYASTSRVFGNIFVWGWPNTSMMRPGIKATGRWVKRQTSTTSDFLFIDLVQEFLRRSHASTSAREEELWGVQQPYLWLL